MPRPLVTVVLSLLASVAAAAAPPSTLIRGARVFDGERLVGVRDVLVSEGRIAAVATSIEPPPGIEIVDASGKTLLPGLIDAHTHTWEVDPLRESAILGVTTNLDMFTLPAFLTQLDDLPPAERRGLADLKTSTILVTAPDGHGTQYGFNIPTIAGPDEAESFVQDRVDDGADYIKIVLEDLRPTLDVPTLRAVVLAAHRRGLLAVCHVSAQSWAEEAVRANVDVLVHMFGDEPASDAFIELAASRDVAIVPTLPVIESVFGRTSSLELAEDDRVRDNLRPAAVTNLAAQFPVRWERTTSFQSVLDSLRRLREAGVTLLAGSDAPNPGTAHGASLRRELELFVEIGMTPAEALAAATSRTADRFRLRDRGRIEPGLRADLLLVRGDPLADIEATLDIAEVWVAGHRVDRTAWQTRLAAGPEKVADGATSISDFDELDIASSIGAGWSITRASMMGGTSTAALQVVEDGAAGTPGALAIEGEVTDVAPQPWAGAQLSPGPMWQPVDLRDAGGLGFHLRGDGRTYALLVFTQTDGFTPSATHLVTATDDWTRHDVTWAELGVEPKDVTAIMWSAGPPAGAFRFLLDGVDLIAPAAP